MNLKCELCGSTNDKLSFHHLIPRTLHSNKYYKKNYSRNDLNKGIWICELHCHKQIHKLISEKEMGKKYNTLEMLLSHPDIANYIDWRKKRL
jgi:hypothetical protein